MPNVPVYREQVSTGTAQGATADPSSWARAASSEAGGIRAIADGVGRVADTLVTIEDANASAWAAKTLSSARLQWTQHLMNKQESAEAGAPNFTPELMKEFDDYAAKTIENAPSDQAKRHLGTKLLDLRNSLGGSALQFEAKARVDYRADMFSEGIQNTQKLMNADPGQYRVALDEQLAVIDAAGIPPAQKSQLRQKAIDDVSVAAVWSQVQRSPAAFMASIGMGPTEPGKPGKGNLAGVTGNEAFDALPFNRRVQMFEEAVRAKSHADIEADKAATKQREALAENAMKEGWGRLASGKLTRGFVEEMRPVLSANEYHALLTGLKAGSGAGQKTDAATYRELQNLLYTDPEQAEKFAFKAHKSGLLSNENLSSALTRSRELSRSEGPKSEYERTRKYIVGSLDPGPMVQDPVSRQRLAEANDEFDRWVMAGKRTDEEVRVRGREIVDQYKFIDLSQTVMALPSPRSGTIRRNPQDTKGIQQDILSAKQRADDNLKSGKFTQFEYDAEMSTLNRWRKAVEPKK